MSDNDYAYYACTAATAAAAAAAGDQFQSEQEFFSDTGYVTKKKPFRSSKARLLHPATIAERTELGDGGTLSSGSVWACCVGTELQFQDLVSSLRRGTIDSTLLNVDSAHSEVLFCRAFANSVVCFIFKFGCLVSWDTSATQQKRLQELVGAYTRDALPLDKVEEDDMNYVWGDRPAIKRDHIQLVTSNIFERLAYAYAFAQSVKLAVFETVVSDTIDSTKQLPEGLAKTGAIKATRQQISRQIGELFVNRFYINLHTDILDTPDIFWDNDDFADHYDHCRRYLEIPKRVEILNHRLDIIKDLYDMLNNELTIQHGYKLEWIVIYLICAEVIIEVVWNILVKDLLHWV